MRNALLDPEALAALRLRNRLQTGLLLAGMFALAAALAHLLLGPEWAPWLAFSLFLGLLAAPRLSPAWLMRLSGATRLTPAQAPQLYALLEALAGRAQLERVPDLYLVPRGLANAFAVGRRSGAAIAVTSGLLRTLTASELAGVLAHEVAHVQHDDMRVMLLAEIVARLTASSAQLGSLLLLINLPLVATGRVHISWGGVALLMASPGLSVLLQLALARSRERQADLEAARLTGQPRALASALRKLGEIEESLLERLFRHRHGPKSTWLRTHPDTDERVRNLLALEAAPEPAAPWLDEEDLAFLARNLPQLRRERPWYLR